MKYIVAPSRPGHGASTLRLKEFLEAKADVEVIEMSNLDDHLLGRGLGCVTIETDLSVEELRSWLSGFIVEQQD